jgi:hypothetical protein
VVTDQTLEVPGHRRLYRILQCNAYRKFCGWS